MRPMTNAETWAGRVSEWKGSGLSCAAYCEGKPFSVSGVRYWAGRRRQMESTGPARDVGSPKSSAFDQPLVRLGRVFVRREAGMRSSAVSELAKAQGPSVPETLVVECGGMRV